ELVRRAQAGRGDDLKAALGTLCAVLKEEVGPELAAMLERGDAEHRAAAAGALGGGEDPAPAGRLRQALAGPRGWGQAGGGGRGRGRGDREVEVRAAAAGEVSEYKAEEAAEVLLERLPVETPAVLRTLLRALGRTHSPRAFAELERALAHADATVRRAAVAGL